MADFSGQNYTSFSGVNIKGSVALRVEGQGVSGTLRADLSEGLNRAWSLPNKSGTFPIMGTFSVQLPATSTSVTQYSTIAVVAGIRTEDAIAVIPNKGSSAGYSFSNAGGTARVLIAAEAQNGQILLTFSNIGVTGYVDQIYSYLAMR